MQIELIEKEGLKRELNIQVPVEVVSEAYAKIYSEYRKKANIKGFRQGKAPLDVIRRKFKDEATHDLIDDLVKKYFVQALEEKKLDPIGEPVISKIDVDEGKPLTFTIGIEVMPEIDSVKYENLVVEEPEIEIPDKMVDNVVERLRLNASDVRAVDRPAGEKDIVICDLEITEGDVDPGPVPMTNQEIDLSDEYTVNEFREGLLGAKRDDNRDLAVVYPEEYADEKFAGKTVTYKVHVKEVKERILPMINDDFAKQTGGGETLLELRMSIRKGLEENARGDIRKADKKQIVDQVVEQNAIDVPGSMSESYLNGVIKDIREHEKNIDEEQIRDQYRPLAQHAVRWYFLYHRLATQENIKAEPADIDQWTQRFADNYHMDITRAKEILAKSGRAEEIKDGILEEKVVDFLMARARVKKVAPANKEGNE